MRKLTEQEYRAMAYVVPDPDAWIAHAEKFFGPEKAPQVIADKIASCLTAVAAVQPGAYKTRAERDLENAYANTPTLRQIEIDRAREYADMTIGLAAAKKLGLTLAEAEFTKRLAELDKAGTL